MTCYLKTPTIAIDNHDPRAQNAGKSALLIVPSRPSRFSLRPRVRQHPRRL